jgi:hypothetical protein
MTTITLTPDPQDPPTLIAMIDPAPPGRGTRKIRSKAALAKLREEFAPDPTLIYDEPGYVDNLPEDEPDAL